ncbi:Pfam:BB1 [Aspergillus sp. HF37]|nr:Pfam:BB1 [Aspergillus sp. HF37]
MDSLVNGGPYTNKLLLNAIFFSASLYSDHNSLRLAPEDPGTTGKAFYNRFKDLLADYVDEPTMPTIVALILCGSSLVPHGEQSAGWLFCGMAYRMIIDLGYHLDIATSPQTDPNIRLSATDMEIRKRVYWGAYVCDTFQSLFLGRPPTLLKVDCHIPHKYLDTYEEMEEWKPCVDAQTQLGICAYQTQPCYALSTFENLRRLCAVANKIMDKLYSTACSNTPETAALQSRHELRLLLEHWKHGLPSNLRFDPETDNIPPPHQITLHTTYWALVILTEQPFLKPGHFNFGPGPQCQTEAKERCIEAALKIWKLVEAYKNVFTLRRAQYGIFYATYGAVLVMLQHAPQDSEDYIRCIQFFWGALLEYQNGCSKGLKRPLDLLKPLLHRIENVWQRINVDDPGDASQSHSSGTLCNHLRKHSSSEHLEAQESWSDLSCTNAPGLESADSLDWLASISGDLCFTDDTVFGMFMQNDSDI